MRKLRLAVVGCGAIAERILIPVTSLSGKVDITVMVDKMLPRARQIAEKYNVPEVTDDYREIIGKVDAAIIALPHYMHAPVSTDLLRSGINVLVEKPMALKASDCDEMIKAASDSGSVLAVRMDYHFCSAFRFIKQIIENGLLGNIQSFDLRQGFVYGWSVVDISMLQKGTGGGVLTGIGPHVLDIILWWLGDFESVEYYDDAAGGIEADCEIHLKLKSGVTGVVELSRTRNLRNSYIINGDKCMLEVGSGYNPLIRLTTRNEDSILTGQVKSSGFDENSGKDWYRRQLDDFIDSIIYHREPFVSGQEGKRVIELIEACNAVKQQLRLPWLIQKKPSQDCMGVY